MMLLRRLEIIRLPGIEPGFELDGLEPGVTVISGPNGIGKSSLVRALTCLLGPPKKGDPRQLVVRAGFASGRKEWTAERTGPYIVWHRNGRPAERPALPEGADLFFYHLQIEHLLRAEGPDKLFLAEVKRQLFGGFDLEKLRRLPALQTPARALRQHLRAVGEAQKNLRRVEQANRLLLEQQEHLPELQRQREEFEKQAQQHVALERALQLLQQLEEKSRLEGRLRAYPTGMERLRGDELDALQTLEQQARELDRRKQEVQLNSETATRKLLETGLAEADLDQSLFDRQREQLHQLDRLCGELERSREESRALQIREEELTGQLPSTNRQARFSPSALEQARQLARRLHELDWQQQQLRLSLPEDGEPPPADSEVDRHRDGLRALEAWLAATAAGGNRTVDWVGFLLLLAGLVLVLIAGMADRDFRDLLGAGLLLAGVLLLWLKRNRGRQRARARWAETALTDPESWNREQVAARAERLRERLEQMRRARHRAEQAEQARSKLDRVQAQLQELEPERRRLAELVGCDPRRVLEFTATVQLLVHFHELRNQQAQATARREHLERQVNELTRRLVEFLQAWQQPPSDDSPEALREAFERLAERYGRASSLGNEVDGYRRELEALAARLADTQHQVRELYRRAGLEPEQRQELLERLRNLPDWNELQRQLVTVQGAVAMLEAQLKDHPQLIELARRGDAPTLEALREKSARAAEQARELAENLTATQTRLEEAGQELPLEKARAGYLRATQELERAVDAELVAALGSLLLDDIEQEFQSQQQPLVLQRAREFLQMFTNHACALEIGHDSEDLLVRECHQPAKPLRRLEELSTATRMQLLLALRLAWISRLETGREPLPLWLDEALTTCDPGRFEAVARSLVELAARESRQVFYLTARPEEALWWGQLAGRPVHHIQLDKVRGTTIEGGSGYLLLEPQPLPAPDGRTADEYARLLEVPPLRPALGVAMAHPFHLLRDDLELLHRLLDTWRVNSLGQLENLLRSAAAERAIPEEKSRRQLRQRLRLAHCWQEAWSQGRPAPVDRAALAASGAVSDTFLASVAQLAERLKGDGQALLAKLRQGAVKRFATKKIDELEAWLAQQGYLSEEAPLDRDARLARVLSDLGGEIPPQEITRVVAWLEAGAAPTAPAAAVPASS